jgi:tetratricopeptide (TPR) repeat protein
MEADVFSRYGLLNEAIKILEGLKLKEPQNLDVHLRLRVLYAETSDKESLVTEYIVLHELYKRKGDSANSEKMLKEALEINPDDPRLAERGASQFKIEPTSYAGAPTGGFGEVPAEEEEIEDYEEALSEADFYMRQGLTQEAAKILERLHRLFPENKDVAERLTNLGQSSEAAETPLSFHEGLEEQPFGGGAAAELPQEEIPVVTEPEVEEPVSDEKIIERPVFPEVIHEELSGEETKEVVEENVEQPAEKKTEYEEFSFSDQDLVDAQEIPEPELDSDVLEIFQEFKKGLEGELSDEDSETHYNLGIAYKEMGLIDDAIKEFQTSRNDSKRSMQSSTMLGVCYMEKGLFSLAIDILSKAIKEVSDKDESYWALKYELADAYEKNNNLREALDLYTEVFGWNAKFRNVSEKMSQIKTRSLKGSEGEKSKTKKDRVSYL